MTFCKYGYLLLALLLSALAESTAFSVTVYGEWLRTTSPLVGNRRVNDSLLTLEAKKKKKGAKQKKKNQQKSGFEWAMDFTNKPFESETMRNLASVAVASFEGRTGKPLEPELGTALDVPKTLWNSPIACVVVTPVGGEEGSASVKYANVAALETVGLRPDEFEKLLGKASAGKEPIGAEVRIDLPTTMSKNYEAGYTKKIVKKDQPGVNEKDQDEDQTSGGIHFVSDIMIIDAYRWVLEKSSIVEGKFQTESLGVAYAWSQWVKDDNLLCKPGGVTEQFVKVDDVQAAIDKQASMIRELKEVKGFGNKDPEVKEAVDELLRLKSLLESN